MRLSIEIATSLAELPMQGICREYPNKLDHVLSGPNDLRSPRELHPAFYGCYDWHSAVHSHWALIHLVKRFSMPNSEKIRRLLAQNLSAGHLAAEAAYLSEPHRQSFERPYGWAWLLKLAEELHGWDDENGRDWARYLYPLESAIVARWSEFLVRQRFPVRTGTHANTAFSLCLGFDYAVSVGNGRLRSLIEERAVSYFQNDTGYQSWNEPSGADFLSPCLVEADLMRRILAAGVYRDWLHEFLPEIGKGEAKSLLTPVDVSDRTDPQIGHLDGLNLSRAWCLAGIASALPAKDDMAGTLQNAAQHHAVKGLSHVATGDYAGEHWLATFAVYMLSSFESVRSARVE